VEPIEGLFDADALKVNECEENDESILKLQGNFVCGYQVTCIRLLFRCT